MNSFYRMDYANSTDLERWMNERRLPEKPVDLLMKVRSGDFVLAAKFNHDTRLGEVRAVGRVVNATDTVSVEWQCSEFDLRPSPQGKQFWNKDHFKFAATVVDRYMLKAICAEHFPGLCVAQRDNDGPAAFESDSLSSGASQAANGGHIYVIKSPYGFKIGKTRTLRDRTRLFAVKLPFPIEVVMTGWFSDYSAAERKLHRQFASKRLEGEWFDLNVADLKVLRSELPMAGTA